MRALLIPMTAGALLVAGLATPAQAAPQTAGDVHLVTGAELNTFRHTVRYANGTWKTWDASPASNIDNAGDMESVVINGADHVFYRATATHMPTNFLYRHLIRDAAGNWSAGTLPGGMGEQDSKVSVANLNGHIALVDDAGGALKLSLQQNDNTWSAWENVPLTEEISDFAVAANGGVLRLVGANQAGTQIGDFERAANGTWSAPNWTPFNGSPMTAISVAQVGSDLQVVASTYAGEEDELRHSIRHANGVWDQFGDIEGAAGNVPGIGVVSVTSSRGELQMAFSASNGKLYHTIRHANGTWQRFGDATGLVGPGWTGGVTLAAE